MAGLPGGLTGRGDKGFSGRPGQGPGAALAKLQLSSNLGQAAVRNPNTARLH